MGNKIARWLGLADDDVASGKRKTKKLRKVVEHRGVRSHYTGKSVVRGKSKRRRRDPSLPSFCTDNFSGKVKIKGKTVRFIGGVKQR